MKNTSYEEKLLSAIMGSPLIPRDEASNNELKDRTEQALRTLTPVEQKVLKMRFGLEDGTEHSVEEVSLSFERTPEEIREIEATALRKMRHPSRIREQLATVRG